MGVAAIYNRQNPVKENVKLAGFAPKERQSSGDKTEAGLVALEFSMLPGENGDL